ncbi:transposase [Micromonospora haikouensis]|uniref:transposase n=1 Tax=Micromonospora haikouensis TaxID=686309 RepID=UPI0036C64891
MTRDESRAAQAVGRSRSGLTTKIHTLGDGRGRSLATLITPGQAADTRQLIPLLGQVRVPRLGGVGRLRQRPDSLTGDKAYSSRTNRTALRDKGIIAVIPEPNDQIGNRKRKGRRGGRPPTFDPVAYRRRNQVEDEAGQVMRPPVAKTWSRRGHTPVSRSAARAPAGSRSPLWSASSPDSGAG